MSYKYLTPPKGGILRQEALYECLDLVSRFYK
jgi:hypothetical protein